MRPAAALRGSSKALLLAILMLALAHGARAQSSSGPGPGQPQRAATNYVISLAAPEQHLAEITMVLPAGASRRELQLPVWNALYQIRDFAQYVNWVRANDRAGKPLAVQALNTSRWQISGAENGAVVKYQIYVDSPGPFGAEINSHHAFLNLAQVMMYPVDAREAPLTLRFEYRVKEWRIATPLTAGVDGYEGDNYDAVVDSPVEIGEFVEQDFDEAGGHFRVVVDADFADYDMGKLVTMLRKIVAAATSWMNDRPFDTYTFFYHFAHDPVGGGMEHAYSTAIEVSSDLAKNSPEALASVTAHEFFHLWNVKRIRPQSLEPIDYTKENYTRALWFSEGATSTAADTILLRAGLADERQYEEGLSAGISELERRPAHLTQSAEQSSLDAWFEGYGYYRRGDRSISYYNKGELLGVMLDLAVRDASHGQASLREVFQWMNRNYAKKGQFFPDSAGVREAAEAVTHADLGWFFDRYVSGTEEIPWNDFFRTVGLRVMTGSTSVADAGFVASRNFDGPMIVTSVTAGSEPEHAGLRAGDTVLEINGKAAGQESDAEIARLRPGNLISVKIRSQYGTERELRWNVGSREEITYELKDSENVTAEQRARRSAWLNGEAQSPVSTKLGAGQGLTKQSATKQGATKK